MRITNPYQNQDYKLLGERRKTDIFGNFHLLGPKNHKSENFEFSANKTDYLRRWVIDQKLILLKLYIKSRYFVV